MIRKVELEPEKRERFAEPTPLGLIGLALGCAALLPFVFGLGMTPAGMKTAAVFCLLFGGGCQLLAGLMGLRNGNLFGGTLLTAFSFNWFVNGWVLDGLAAGRVPDAHILLAVDLAMLVVFLVFTYGFGFYSKLLFVFLLDIDLLFGAKLAKHFAASAGATDAVRGLDWAIGGFTALLALLALWLAFALLINPTAGRPVFRVPGPLFAAQRAPGFDWSTRFGIFDALYKHWREHAFDELPLEELERRVAGGAEPKPLLAELCYLEERGALRLRDGADGGPPQAVRLTAAGIDLYEQLVLKKYRFAG
ncbi:MAG: hypothetical protein JXB32_25225 [Deltaproteobacteria bacterium]|nr:hypothetical protein [Deltaproteobacteria bacterium]